MCEEGVTVAFANFVLVADLYIVLFDKARADPESVPHGREGFFFGASGEHDLYDVSKAVAEALYAVGKGKSPDPTTFTQDELNKYFNGVCIPTFLIIYTLNSFAVRLLGLELSMCSQPISFYWLESVPKYGRFY